jgi:hypothetical protein
MSKMKGFLVLRIPSFSFWNFGVIGVGGGAPHSGLNVLEIVDRGDPRLYIGTK